MAKALKIAGAVVAVAGLALVTGGLAAGASLSFIMSAGSGLAGLTVGGLFTASALLNTAGSLLSPKPKAPSTSASNADRLTVSMDLRAFRKIVIGTTAMATDLRDQEWSADQSLLHRFVVCASHRSGAVREIWFDDKLAWTLAGGVQGEYRGYLTVVPVLEGSAADAINIGPRMGGARRFTGLTYVYLRYKLTGNSKKTESPFASSIPSRVTIVGDGALFYDPRLDSTVPGGAGPMRANNERTWAWNASACRNPALALLFYLLGWRIQNPVTGEWKLAVGKGIPASRIDLPSFITAANLCDEPVTTAAGVSEPRYRADGIFSEGDDPGLVLDNLKAAMNAVLDDADGKIRVTVLHNDLATPIGDLSAADVLGEFTWLQTPPLTDSINVIRGGYIDPSRTSLFQLVDFPEVAIASPDGIDRPQTVNLALVQSPSQAQRLVKMRLARAQYGGTYTAIFQATAWKYQKGDVIRFSFHPLGWDKKLFRIADVATQVDGTVPMMLREEHPAIYAAYSDERAAVQPAAPTSYDPSLWPVLQGIVDAGTTAEWPGITGPGKPADDATNSADPDSPFGPDGTVKETIATLARIDPIEVKTQLLDLIQADQAAAIRQAARDNAALARALLRATDELNRTREVFRDAGINKDPATGEVRIYAVDQVADRTSQAEIRLNAVQSSLNLRVTLDQLNEAILKAQLDPTGQVDVDAIFSRLTNVEIGLNGINATLLLKADAETVKALGGVITNVSTSLDALAGTVATKASSTEVSGLTERVGSVEQTIRTLGDVSSMSVELRQARIAVGKAGQALLAGVVANEEANQRMVLALSQARQELQTFTTEGLKAEAFARTLLTARVGGTEASLATEIRVRAEQNAAMTQSITEQGVRIGQVNATIVAVQKAQADDRTANAQAIEQLRAGIAAADGKAVAVDARVTRLAETSASEDAALARLIQQVSARISGLGEVGLEQAFQAVVSRLGKIEGRYTVTIDANGNLNGFQLIGSDAGPGTLNLINTDLRMGSGRIILATPESMLAIGLGFGAQKDLLLWYGPRISLDACSRSNARMHLPTVGQAYFGGGLSAGKMSTPGETPSLAADAVATVPWFGSDGRPVQYVCAWSYRSTSERIYPPTAEGRDAYDRDVAAYNATGDQFQSFGQKTVEQPRSTVTLSRTFDGNTYTQLEQVGYTTQRLTFRGIAPTVGDAPGRGTFTTDIGGGFTTRDPVQSTGNRALRLSLSRGFNLGVDGVVQRLSIVAVEE